MGVDAGWLPDPAKRHDLRYWDGTGWTHHVSTKGQQSTDGFLPSIPPAGAGTTAAAGGPAPVRTPAQGAPDAHTLIGKGVTGRIVVDQHFVTITRKGAMAKMNYGFTRGEKRIAIGSISAVQYKSPGMSNGYIQFTLSGANESTRGILSSTQDENSVVFSSSHRREFEAIRDHIESVIVARHQPVAAQPVVIAHHEPRSVSAELRDLAQLRDDGILTEEEFAAQKAKLLG